MRGLNDSQTHRATPAPGSEPDVRSEPVQPPGRSTATRSGNEELLGELRGANAASEARLRDLEQRLRIATEINAAIATRPPRSPAQQPVLEETRTLTHQRDALAKQVKLLQRRLEELARDFEAMTGNYALAAADLETTREQLAAKAEVERQLSLEREQVLQHARKWEAAYMAVQPELLAAEISQENLTALRKKVADERALMRDIARALLDELRKAPMIARSLSVGSAHRFQSLQQRLALVAAVCEGEAAFFEPARPPKQPPPFKKSSR